MAFAAVTLSAFHLSLPLPRNTFTAPEPADQNQSAESCSIGLEIWTPEDGALRRGSANISGATWLRRNAESKQAFDTRLPFGTSFHRLHLFAAFDLIET